MKNKDTERQHLYGGYALDIIHSPDDGGYYAEVYTTQGETVYTTSIFADSKYAGIAAVEWIDKQEENDD